MRRAGGSPHKFEGSLVYREILSLKTFFSSPKDESGYTEMMNQDQEGPKAVPYTCIPQLTW